MTAKRTVRKAPSSGILLRYRDKDTAYGVTRKTTTRLAQTLGLSETQVVHVALARESSRRRRRATSSGAGFRIGGCPDRDRNRAQPSSSTSAAWATIRR